LRQHLGTMDGNAESFQVLKACINVKVAQMLAGHHSAPIPVGRPSFRPASVSSLLIFSAASPRRPGEFKACVVSACVRVPLVPNALICTGELRQKRTISEEIRRLLDKLNS
jgi:hypothetical protein